LCLNDFPGPAILPGGSPRRAGHSAAKAFALRSAPRKVPFLRLAGRKAPVRHLEGGGPLCRLRVMGPIQSQRILFRSLLDKELAFLQIVIQGTKIRGTNQDGELIRVLLGLNEAAQVIHPALLFETHNGRQFMQIHCL
jgi:hypothetical protein